MCIISISFYSYPDQNPDPDRKFIQKKLVISQKLAKTSILIYQQQTVK
jgi:hypothetical protein